ncbi:MazG-like family protein [Sphingobium lignivorans]|uniref:NTP pyrophosphatase (Non-canonical NTP hydrolase) n=1 Tax=Sphingobium lignivorans TaxID=2735886 RepID=A0ABR6NFC7_9SPHN|nr:MazG-like family protein [Sphingobium lignivorans]MBB5985980.1 NTP pyrophosphatase (non-canonical NTP hydrolase) [Sphingobium lignivorans]
MTTTSEPITDEFLGDTERLRSALAHMIRRIDDREFQEHEIALGGRVLIASAYCRLSMARNTTGEDFLDQLRRINGERYAAWSNGSPEDPLYMANEFGGEAGEVLNEVKKLVREARGWRGSRTTIEKLGDEIGDAIICLDSIARSYGLSLAEVTARKFNKTSDAVGLPQRLEV